MIATIIGCAIGVLGFAFWAIRGPLRASVREVVGALDVLNAQLAKPRDETGAQTRVVIMEFERRLIALAEIVDRLPSKWEDVRREADSLYKRTRHHIRRVTEELDARGLEDPELEGLAFEVGGVQGRDDGGSDESRVPGVPSDVGTPQHPDPVEALIARKWGG